MDNQIQKHSDEVDLINLFNRIGRALRYTFEWFLMLFKSLFKFLIQKSLWIIAFAFFGALIGYNFYKSTPRYYSSEMIARSNSINNSVIINSINLLNDIFENKNYVSIASYFGISTQNAKKIKSIEAFYGIDLNRDKVVDIIDYDKIYNPKDTTQKRLKDIFYLRIRVYDETVFNEAREGIKKYLISNHYIVEYDSISKIQTKNLIKEYDIQLKKLDSLQKIQYFESTPPTKSGSNQMIILNEKEKKLYHTEYFNLFNKKLELEKDLLLNPEAFSIIQDFTPLSKAENPLNKFLKIWVSLFITIGLILSIIWQYRKVLWILFKE